MIRAMNLVSIHVFFPSRLRTEYPNHPLVVSVAKRETEFDELAAKYSVPPLAIRAA